MATDFIKARSIKYLNKDFNSFKRDLIRYTQAHNSGVFQDFNEASPGMAILEMCAYVGDVLSFYQDMQFEEFKFESARQIENVVSFAKKLGYRPSGKRAATGIQSFIVEVPATVEGSETKPDDLYTPILRKGARVIGPNGSSFETTEDVYFSASLATYGTTLTRAVTGSRFDSNTGLPTHFAIMKDAPVIAGETKSTTFTINDFQQFLTLELPDVDVIEVLSVIDSDDNEWTEVEYLAQEMVYDSTVNVESDSNEVPYILKYVAVPRRFVTDRDPLTNKTSLVFGSGDGLDFDDELLPNIADMAIPLPGRSTFTSYAIDPQNFLKTRTLGLSPFNTTLTVRYRVGGGSHTNVDSNVVNTIVNAEMDFTSTSLNALKKGAVESSIDTFNRKKMDGGGPEESISEIKANASAFFAAQNRIVTVEDFIARIMSLPAKYGKPEKVFVKHTDSLVNSFSVDAHILTKDENGHLSQATTSLMNNIKNYISPLRMLTDGINLLGADIINIRIEFGIVVSPKYNRVEVLGKCLDVVRDYMSIDKMQIYQPIVLSDLSSELQQILGVISVYKLDIKNVFGIVDGLTYSSVRFDTSSNTSNNILYCPQNAIFEVKFPIKDIVGESK